MRIAHVGLKGIPVTYGGIEQVTEVLASRMAQRGHSVAVYARSHYTPRSMIYRGVEVRRLPSWDSKYTDALSHTFLSLVDVRRRWVDVVHLHSLGPAIFTPLARALGLRVVVHLHGQEWQGGKWGRAARLGFKAAEWPAVYAPHELVVVSAGLQDYYKRKFGRAAQRIPNGVDLPAVRPWPGEVNRLTGFEPGEYLLFVGRLVPEKGLDTLLEARASAVRNRPLVLVGDADHSVAYARHLRQKWSSDRVRFLGWVYGAALSQLYASSWAFIQPSRREGLSMTLLEAMAHGCRIVASDIAPNREVLGDTGSYVPVGSVGELRAALDALERDRSRADWSAARDRVAKHFQWDGIIDRWEQVYERVARAHCPV
ncbi:MAG TPA: glycosyltransferase family 4 protein [Chloroflexota bacterium]|nr:glycosyltransferase family 4 protein [Chloroflexota bacterium]